MYFSIDYKFVFVYEASLSPRAVCGGSNPLLSPYVNSVVPYYVSGGPLIVNVVPL